jgi:hypothetical protein
VLALPKADAFTALAVLLDPKAEANEPLAAASCPQAVLNAVPLSLPEFVPAPARLQTTAWAGIEIRIRVVAAKAPLADPANQRLSTFVASQIYVASIALWSGARNTDGWGPCLPMLSILSLGGRHNGLLGAASAPPALAATPHFASPNIGMAPPGTIVAGNFPSHFSA